MFVKKDDGVNKFEVIPRKAEDVFSKLDPNVYDLTVEKDWNSVQIFFSKNNRYKNSTPINTGVFAEAIDHVNFFLSPEAMETRDELGMMHKMALIFNGGPGTGKTFLAGQLMEKLVKEKEAVCIMSKGDPKYVEWHQLIDAVRLEDPDRWIGILIDEYEKRSGDDLDMLSFLDGTNSRKNVLVIATVNSTKKLPETITNRIGRVERIYNFDTDDANVIKAMITSVIPEKYKESIDSEAIAKEFIEFGIKPSIDFISVLVRNKIYELKTGKSAPELLDGIRKAKDKKKAAKKSIGFVPIEKSEKDLEKERELEEMREEGEAVMENMMKAMILSKVMSN